MMKSQENRRLNNRSLAKMLKVLAVLLDNKRTFLSGVEILKECHLIHEDIEILSPTQKRDFERIKANLKTIGIELETRTEAMSILENQSGKEKNFNACLYRIPHRTYALRDIGLTSEEEAVLKLLGRILAQEEGFPLRLNLGMAMQKIFSASGNPAVKKEKTAAIKEPAQATAPRHDPAMLDKLIEAGAKYHPVSFTYESFHTESVIKRKVEPYGFFTRRGVWYMVGNQVSPPSDESQSNSNVRVFRISRIQKKSTVQIHASEYFKTPKGFNLRDYSHVPPWNFYQDVDYKPAEIRFDAGEFWRVRNYCEEHGDLARDENGNIIWSLKVKEYAPLIKWMLPFGAAAAPLGPDDFIQQYRQVIHDMLLNYGG